MITYIVSWFCLMILAILNGAIREKLLPKNLGELKLQQISTFTLIAVMFVYTYVYQKLFPLTGLDEAKLIGFVWLLLTLAFEFIFGKVILKKSWKELLANYNFMKGRLWVLIVIWVFLVNFAIYELIN